MRTALFIPCYVDQLYPQVGVATVAVLERCGVSVDFPAQQTCCGQPAYNAGFWDEAKQIGTKFLHDFSDDRVIVSPSASCTARTWAPR